MNHAKRRTLGSNDSFIEELFNSGHYSVDQNGNIFTLKTKNGRLSTKWRYVSGSRMEGYKVIGFKKRTLLMHRVVYRFLIGPLSSNLVINHKDGNKQNNHPSNLELVTSKENNRHSREVLGNLSIIHFNRSKVASTA